MLSAVKHCVCNYHSLCHVVILRWEGLVLRWENGWQAGTCRRTKSNWCCYLHCHFLDCEWCFWRFVPYSIYGRTFVRFWWMFWSWASRFQSLTELKFLKMSFVFQKKFRDCNGTWWQTGYERFRSRIASWIITSEVTASWAWKCKIWKDGDSREDVELQKHSNISRVETKYLSDGEASVSVRPGW